MSKFEIYRADLNKVLLTTEASDAADAFGKWLSGAMLAGFVAMRDSSYNWIDSNKWEVKTVAGKTFMAEVREI